MRHDLMRIWRLTLPDDLDPDGYWCVSFSIPAGVEYVNALTAALGLLTIQKTWARDDTGSAAMTVAHTWERALYLNPLNVSQMCVVFPNPPIPDFETADDWSAAVFIQWFQHLAIHFNTCAPTPGDCAACVDEAMIELAPYGANSQTRYLLEQLCQHLNELSPAERAEYETDCPYYDLQADLADDINDNPYDWLNQLSDWLFGFLDGLSDAILGDLINITGGIGGGGIAQFIDDLGGPDPGSGAGFGGDCAWSHTFDFTTGEHGWMLDGGLPSICGEYVPATGYHTTLNWDSAEPGAPGTEFNKGVTIYIPDVGSVDVTRLVINYTATWGENTAPYETRQMYSNICGSDDYPNAIPPYDHSGSWTWVSMYVELRTGYDPFNPPPDPQGDGLITSITIYGLGASDPYDGL